MVASPQRQISKGNPMKKCKCGMPIYNQFKECDKCFKKKLKTPAKKNIFLQGNYYKKDKPNVVGNAEL